MSKTTLCPECLTVQPRHMFQDGVCHICAKLDKGLLNLKPSADVEEKSQVEAQQEQEELLRLQAEADRVRQEREVEFNLQQEAARELARREAARRNLLPFVMYFNEAYTPGWVHADICRRLEQFSRDVADRKSPRLMLSMPPRSGKQLADSTPVLTTDGWKTHGELRVGDYVFHPSGKPVKVLAVSEKTPSDYVVTFSNGDSIRCHGNHEWTVSHDRKPMAAYSTVWLKDRLTRSESGGKKTRYIARLPDINPAERPEIDLVMHPYVLGLWLGDGSSTKAAITHDKKDQPMIDKVVSCGHVISSVCVHSDTGVVTTYFDGDRKANAGYKDGRCGEMLKQLRALGLINNKHIPEIYHLGSVEQRLELLAGLIDSDGCCDKNGRVSFSTTNERLKDGVMRLATELGFRPYFHKAEPKLSSSGIQGNLPVYVVGFNPNLELPQVIERKKSKRLAVRRLVTIRSIEYEPNGEQGNCIQVDSPDGLYMAGRMLIPTHNSELASKTFPAWHLGHHPAHDIIGSSYSAALAIDFSRKVRGLVQDERYHNIFPTRMDETSQSAERWNTAQGGGYVAAGVQGPITGRGAHCFPAGTKVLMADGTTKNIEGVRIGDIVASYDVVRKTYTVNKVIARQEKYASRFTELRTTSHKSTRATANHKFYSPTLGGWFRADVLKAGDEIVCAPSKDTLCALQYIYGKTDLRDNEIDKTWARSDAMLTSVQRGTPKSHLRDEVCDLRGTSETQQQVLLEGVYTEQEDVGGQELRSVWSTVLTSQQQCNTLFGGVCEQSPLRKNDGRQELELQAWERAEGELLQGETASEGKGQLSVRSMWVQGKATRTPQGREQIQRLDGKLSNCMRKLPYNPPQVERDTVSSATTYDTGVAEPVYDIQIENTACFFADGLLAHNCAIIDDPVKDREAAESEINRQAVKDWYSSTLYTRLAPGGGILVIQTRWHSDDLSGWLLECMREAEQELAETGEWPEDADRWEVVKYPAIATHDEEYRKAGEALHPERYDIKALNKIKRTLIPRDWEALYQQNPVSADGDYFKKEHFRLYDTAPDISTLRVYAAWDLAIGKKDTNDFTCGVVIGIDRSNDIWVLHRYYGRWSADELIQKFFECQDTWSPALQGIEHGQIEMTLEPFILKEMNEKKKRFNYIKLKTRGNDKMTRARPIQGRMEQGRVHFPRQAPWFQEMQNEMLAFPAGKHDDQVDALAWIGQMILMLAPEREKRPPPKRGWRDRLRKQLRGSPLGVSHMAS